MSEGPADGAEEQSAGDANRRASERAGGRPGEDSAERSADDLEERTTDDGTAIFVASDEGARGSDGPFRVAYADPACDRRYGWVCGHCGSLATAMDPMGRVECTDCGNRRKPTEWDPAHE